MKLVEVLPDAAVVARAGVRERIELEVPQGERDARARATRRQTPQFRLNVASSGNNTYSLSRKELDDTLKDPQQLNHLGRISPNPSGGGVRMESAPPGSLPAKLGLQAGDVIKKVNGQAGPLARRPGAALPASSAPSPRSRPRCSGRSTTHLSYAIQP